MRDADLADAQEPKQKKKGASGSANQRAGFPSRPERASSQFPASNVHYRQGRRSSSSLNVSGAPRKHCEVLGIDQSHPHTCNF